jgi:hypothetical protein
VFSRRGAPLLVTECFAPAIAAFDAPQRARAVPWRTPVRRESAG